MRVHGRIQPITSAPGTGGPTGATRGKVPTLGHAKKSELQNHVLNITSFKITPGRAYKLFMSGDGGKGLEGSTPPPVLGGTPGCGNGRAEPTAFSALFTFTAFELFYNVIPSPVKINK